MFQVVYDYPENWPEDGPLLIETKKLTLEIQVSPLVARRRANGYLGRYVAMSLLAGEPTLHLSERPTWQMAVDLHLPGFGFVATVGKIAVDAVNGSPLPLTLEEVEIMQDRADELATRLTSPTKSIV